MSREVIHSITLEAKEKGKVTTDSVVQVVLMGGKSCTRERQVGGWKSRFFTAGANHRTVKKRAKTRHGCFATYLVIQAKLLSWLKWTSLVYCANQKIVLEQLRGLDSRQPGISLQVA